MWDLIKIVGTLAAIRYFIIEPLNVSVELTSAGAITAIICSVIAFAMIVIPFTLRGGK